MNKAQERLAERLYEEEVIKFGNFKLKLHGKNPEAPLSPIFFNLRTEDNPGKNYVLFLFHTRLSVKTTFIVIILLGVEKSFN